MKKNLGWLGYIGDEILPSYIGIIMNHEIRIPFLTIQDSMESHKGFLGRGSDELQNCLNLAIFQAKYP